MQRICTNDDVQHLGTILGVWAHPDDDTYSMGGIMAAAIHNGQKVIIITATRGEAGVQDEARWPASKLAEIRTKEMAAALHELGVTEHHWLDYPDGGCKNSNEAEAVNRIAALITQYQPDSILTFGRDGMTGHDDHKTVSRWTTLAAKQAGSRAHIFHTIQTKAQYEAMQEADEEFNIFFNIDKPHTRNEGQCAICLQLDDELYDRKLAALTAMPSQTEAMFAVFRNDLRNGIGVEAFITAEQDARSS
jgi:LmbE family N-acetylglucosaminyl deacetylase